MLNRLVNPHFPRAAAGLRRESVSVVSLARSGRQFALQRAASVELPEGVLQPSFTELNIELPQDVLNALREAATSAGLHKQKRWSISLPADTAKTAILTLETAPKSKNELNEVLNWKAERAFGIKPSEMRLAFQPLSPEANQRARYFSVGVKLDVLAEYEDLFDALGWNVGLILPRHISEAQWLMLSKHSKNLGDALLVSSQADGFTAMLLHGEQPTVIRSVACEVNEREDELYRLLLFYRDRLARIQNEPLLERFLIIGEGFNRDRLDEIAMETLGHDAKILRPEDVGLNLPDGSISFEEIAAPAALASLALR